MCLKLRQWTRRQRRTGVDCDLHSLAAARCERGLIDAERAGRRGWQSQAAELEVVGEAAH